MNDRPVYPRSHYHPVTSSARECSIRDRIVEGNLFDVLMPIVSREVRNDPLRVEVAITVFNADGTLETVVRRGPWGLDNVDFTYDQK